MKNETVEKKGNVSLVHCSGLVYSSGLIGDAPTLSTLLDLTLQTRAFGPSGGFWLGGGPMAAGEPGP